MYLSECFPTEQIFRDGEFSALGLSNSKGPEGMLSFLEDARFASELLDNPRIRAVICRPEDGAAVAERKQGVVLSDTPRLAFSGSIIVWRSCRTTARRNCPPSFRKAAMSAPWRTSPPPGWCWGKM